MTEALLAFAKSTFQKQKPATPLPQEIAYLWKWFEEIYDPGGELKALTYQEIESYSRLTGTYFHPWEVRLLRTLSEEFIQNARRSRLASKTGVKNIVSMDDTEGLKALFSGRSYKPS